MQITETATLKNWAIGPSATTLDNIHTPNINIAIYERTITALQSEVNQLVAQEVELRSKGTVDTILNDISIQLSPGDFKLILKDIKQLLEYFKTVSGAQEFRLLLATVKTNMCRKFHTDINDLRMLCTYKGPGTLWLTEENLNRAALEVCGNNEAVVRDFNKIQQAKAGHVVLLKGAIYPAHGTRAIAHQSPSIEGKNQTRLLLRIDTNSFLNFD
jgi:hypothetical protein